MDVKLFSRYSGGILTKHLCSQQRPKSTTFLKTHKTKPNKKIDVMTFKQIITGEFRFLIWALKGHVMICWFSAPLLVHGWFDQASDRNTQILALYHTYRLYALDGKQYDCHNIHYCMAGVCPKGLWDLICWHSSSNWQCGHFAGSNGHHF